MPVYWHSSGCLRLTTRTAVGDTDAQCWSRTESPRAASLTPVTSCHPLTIGVGHQSLYVGTNFTLSKVLLLKPLELGQLEDL